MCCLPACNYNSRVLGENWPQKSDQGWIQVNWSTHWGDLFQYEWECKPGGWSIPKSAASCWLYRYFEICSPYFGCLWDRARVRETCLSCCCWCPRGWWARGDESSNPLAKKVPELVNLLERLGKPKDTNAREAANQVRLENKEVDQAHLRNVEEAQGGKEVVPSTSLYEYLDSTN